jgi:hypothetical protein
MGDDRTGAPVLRTQIGAHGPLTAGQPTAPVASKPTSRSPDPAYTMPSTTNGEP